MPCLLTYFTFSYSNDCVYQNTATQSIILCLKFDDYNWMKCGNMAWIFTHMDHYTIPHWTLRRYLLITFEWHKVFMKNSVKLVTLWVCGMDVCIHGLHHTIHGYQTEVTLDKIENSTYSLFLHHHHLPTPHCHCHCHCHHHHC